MQFQFLYGLRREDRTQGDAYRLSEELQSRIAKFFHEHRRKTVNILIRKALLEYVIAVTEENTPNGFSDSLWHFVGLMHFFDMAEKEILLSQ